MMSTVRYITLATRVFELPSTQLESGNSGGNEFPWFALRVRSKHERTVADQLRGRGFDEFAPSLKTDRKWTDRVKALDEFLFPGYVFCRFDPNNRFPIVSVRGVVHVVSFGDGPAAIPDLEIERVRKMVDSGLLVHPWPFLKIGERVRIEKGPLTGIEGLLESVKGKHRLVVSINLLQRSVSTEIDRAWVSPMRPNPRLKDSSSSSLVFPKQNLVRS